MITDLSIQQRANIFDLHVPQILCAEANQAIKALHQIQKTITSDQSLILHHSSLLVGSVTLRIWVALSLPDSPMLVKLCKCLLFTMVQFFENPILARSVRLDTLYSITSNLVRRLVDTDLDHRDSGSQLLKGLRILVVSILDNSLPDPVLTVLLRMLGDALKRIVSAGDAGLLSNRGEVNYATETMEYLCESMPLINEHLRENRLDIDCLLVELHLVYKQAIEARKMAWALHNLPLRIIENMLDELTMIYGQSILDHFRFVENATESKLYTYTLKLIELQAKKALELIEWQDEVAAEHAVSSAGTSASASQSGSLAGSIYVPDSSDAFNTLNNHYGLAPNLQQIDNEASGTHRQRSEIMQELHDIFDKIAHKEHSKQAIQDLHTFQKSYPFMQTQVDEQMSITGQFFQTYIKRNLALLDQGMTSSSSAWLSSNWAAGLDHQAAAELFIDCYRMRVDDDFTWAGKLRSGSLYDPDHTRQTIAADFLVFCHLARFVGAVPVNGWDWVSCLDTYGHLLNYAFEKCDARDKYGRKNFFSGRLVGRSLSFTGEKIYGSCVTGGKYDNPSVEILATVAEVDRLESLVCNGIDWNPQNKIFKGVGGFAVWNRLLGNLKFFGCVDVA